jgi:membrane-associated protease RseP (regulator of RpoE activity)
LKTNNHGVATASEQVSWVVGQLEQFRAVRRGWLGVNIQQVTKEVAEALGTKPGGALVASATDKGPAKAGGIEEGDIITAIDGREVKDPRHLASAIGMTAPAQIDKLTIMRRGNEIKKAVTLGQLSPPASTSTQPANAQAPAKTAAAPPSKPTPPTTSPTANLLVLGLVDLNDKLRQAYGIAAACWSYQEVPTRVL